ncbi:MAG: HPr family phosphocarrier protein [Leptospiraceae bacterium]|nr:HPr family phosphocarrier protein [Leptospiraceae bacterium]
MISKEVIIQNASGVHARPAATFVKLANRFKAEIFVEKAGHRINGKSIMGLMMLALTQGAKIQVIADGEDEDTAVEKLTTLVENGFQTV